MDPVIASWLAQFNTALTAGDADRIAALFDADSHWRDLLALTWNIETFSGGATLARRLAQSGAACQVRHFSIDPQRCAPRLVERAGVQVIEAMLRFETATGIGAGLVRFRCDERSASGSASGSASSSGNSRATATSATTATATTTATTATTTARATATTASLRAWTLLTRLEDLKGYEEAQLRSGREEPPFARDFHGPNWQDQRRAAAAYTDHDPAVLIVGGGHAGVTTAARLGQLGVDALVIDKETRIGDNWRLRYHGLKLHNQVHSNHLPYIRFPPSWPLYLSKDKFANWLEAYVESMEINFWTRTALEGAVYDAQSRTWSARLRCADGSLRTMRPRHIVMATSVSGTPHLPQIPGLERFGGTVLHSSQFGNGAQWRDHKVLVFGTGTSAHDIAQDLHGSGARVTMVQRSPTLVVNVEPSAQLYDGVYLGEGPSLEDRDLINASMVLPLTKVAHKLLTDKVKAIDKPLLDGLETAGFKLDFGEGGTGWPLKYRTRGGGYYFNVGCSELIVSGAIDLIQYQQIADVTPQGLRMQDGRSLQADLIVLATGYKGQGHLVETLFGADVAQRLGPVWGFDAQTQELRNMWARTAQPGLWFTAGAFSQCRIYSKILALQIKAAEIGVH